MGGGSFMLQDWTWLFKSASPPCHLHPLSLWRQKTWNNFTWRWKCLFNIVSHEVALHSGQAFFSPCILLAASRERCLPQHDVRWGWSNRSVVTGQNKSSDGCSSTFCGVDLKYYYMQEEISFSEMKEGYRDFTSCITRRIWRCLHRGKKDVKKRKRCFWRPEG